MMDFPLYHFMNPTQVEYNTTVKLEISPSEEDQSEENPFQCDQCEKSFNRKGNLRKHQLIHEGVKPHKCDVCQKCFIWRWKLKDHLLTHTGKEACEKIHQCDECEKSFARKDHLKQHQTVHIEGTPFKCNLCEKGFKRKERLKAHLQLHTGEKSFACEICEKSFARKDHLTRHQSLHNGQKPYKCPSCPSCFRTSYHLKMHKLFHSENSDASTLFQNLDLTESESEESKIFKCDQCLSCFSRPSTLAQHQLAVHQKEKMFRCETCGKAFNDYANFKRHQILHTGEKPFKCIDCPMSFQTKQNLERHRSKKHDSPHAVFDANGSIFIDVKREILESDYMSPHDEDLESIEVQGSIEDYASQPIPEIECETELLGANVKVEAEQEENIGDIEDIQSTSASFIQAESEEKTRANRRLMPWEINKILIESFIFSPHLTSSMMQILINKTELSQDYIIKWFHNMRYQMNLS